jgi:signal transduction histidine kinase
MPPSIPRARRLALVVGGVTLTVFGALLLALTLSLRAALRAEALRREAETMQAIAQLQIDGASGALPGDEAIFSAVLGARRLRGVFSVQVFDARGVLWRALPLAPERELKPDWEPGLAVPRARYDERGVLEDVYGLKWEPRADLTRAPLLAVLVPLRREPSAGAIVGVARYWLDGTALAAEYARLDRRLTWQAGLAFAGGAAVIAAVLWWAFGRLAESQRQLLAQGADLARANEELVFAAKTDAVGAISAHLIHGLKNPLSGLEGYVAERAAGAASDPGDAEWRAAVETTRRLRALVNEVTEVLREASPAAGDYAVTMGDLLAGVASRLAGVAAAAEVKIQVEAVEAASIMLPVRVANLASLVLANLGGNAIEAAARGGIVTLRARCAAGRITVEVADTGGAFLLPCKLSCSVRYGAPRREVAASVSPSAINWRVTPAARLSWSRLVRRELFFG